MTTNFLMYPELDYEENSELTLEQEYEEDSELTPEQDYEQDYELIPEQDSETSGLDYELTPAPKSAAPWPQSIISLPGV